MKATFRIVGITPLQQGNYIQSSKLKDESPEQHDARCWKERAHWDEKTSHVFIPGMAIKLGLITASKHLGYKIPGRGQSTYTKHFERGIGIFGNVTLKQKADDLVPVRIFVPSNGQKGSGKRVFRTFPTLVEWESKPVTIHVFDYVITESVLAEHLDAMGKYVGAGLWRPENGGENGRFRIVDWKVELEPGEAEKFSQHEPATVEV